MNSKNRIWIVGGSSGIGLELVKKFLNNGFYVIVSSRNATLNESLNTMKSNYTNSLELLNLDVEDNDLNAAVEEAWKIYDGLDIWIYNAAAYEVISIEQWSIEKFAQMNSINYMGAVKLMNVLLPYFKNQGHGKWVWNLSLSSYFGLPKGGAYSAPKSALLNLAQSIHPELQQCNIVLQVVNHGFVRTRLTAKNDFEMPQLMTPEYTAEKIYQKLLSSDQFEIRFPFLLSIFLRFLSLLPYKISLNITRKFL